MVPSTASPLLWLSQARSHESALSTPLTGGSFLPSPATWRPCSELLRPLTLSRPLLMPLLWQAVTGQTGCYRTDSIPSSVFSGLIKQGGSGASKDVGSSTAVHMPWAAGLQNHMFLYTCLILCCHRKRRGQMTLRAKTWLLLPTAVFSHCIIDFCG